MSSLCQDVRWRVGNHGLNCTTVNYNAMCILCDYGDDALNRVCVVFVNNLLTPAADQ